MNNFLPELEQDPFDPEEFVERLAWRATAGKFDPDSFDPELLLESFESGIRELKQIYETHKHKCERSDEVLKNEEKRHWTRVYELQERCKESFCNFQELDGHLDGVAAKVVYLGDQLEGVNLPRSRMVEAQKLMKSFAEFLSPGPLSTPLMTEPSQLYEEADIIQKLFLIAQELPVDGGKFDKAREKISYKYDQIERELIEEFVNAQSRNDPDKQRMREIAQIMSHFRGYNQCIDAFIEQSQAGIFLTPGIFTDVLPICDRSQALVKDVFVSQEQQEKVMSRFILNLYHGKIQEYVQNKLLSEKTDPEKYLNQLHDVYSKTQRLSEQLSANKVMGANITFLNTCTRAIFSKFLDPPPATSFRDDDSYFKIEKQTLEGKCSLILKRYYESKNHQKKHIQSGSIQELKRDIQAKIGRANINIANINITVSGLENYGSETFLSEEVAINILQETKLALNRCSTLSKPSDLPKNATDILELQIKYLITEHIDYALDLALYAIPASEPKSQPEIHFFEVVRQSNAVCHLLEKQFVDAVVPVVVSTPKHADCIKIKKEAFEQMENKLNSGLERMVNAIISWGRLLLTRDQKKNEYMPETDDLDMRQTSACSKVCKFMSSAVEKIGESLDGKNVENVLKELGIRYHRLIYEHILTQQVSSVGAMILICDVNEYRKCAADFRIPLLTQLLDTLHDLCNLLVVPPENIRQISSGERLAALDKAVIHSFIQLRSDFKSAKLNLMFK